MWSICKKDLAQFYGSLTGYIVLILFLITNGLFLFVLHDSSILENGYAEMDQFFNLSPWIMMFLIPAITMRTLSEERRTGTLEILRTMPLQNRAIVIGKFLSVVIIIMISLLPTFLYVYTIQALSINGIIDSGAIAGSYFGLFMMACSFAAIGICCSSFTNNQVIAFLIGLFSCLILYYGFSALSRIPSFQGGVDYYLEMAGIDFHYRAMSKGVIDSRDCIYFITIWVLGLFITEKKLKVV